jgi:hypothetical protein
MNKTRRIRWAEQVASMVELRNSYRILVGNHEEKRSLLKI